jgi:hypothetical protein
LHLVLSPPAALNRLMKNQEDIGNAVIRRIDELFVKPYR